ncbi:cellulose binding domain-containing protein [Methylococcus geothermalis]|uniref:Uncharacterized protein n=1 Tax=Methylococcus geothermalis TaxID=2681310 RepID=A0A858Q6M2_9GAMM|nr:cellulose binding domain-containing protein [Methylococcus geothermalis]QJD29471.1 hypothetical protein GNH96_05515 [Methylococcus geothermalis]
MAVLTSATDSETSDCAHVEVQNTARVHKVWHVALPVEGTVTRVRNAVCQAGAALTVDGDGWNRAIPVGGAARFEDCRALTGSGMGRASGADSPNPV